MARTYTIDESTKKYFGDRSELTRLILGSGATCHMKPDVFDFIPESLVETYKYIEVVDRNFVPAKQTEEI